MLFRQLWPAVLATKAVTAQSLVTITGAAASSLPLSGDGVLPSDLTYATISTTRTIDQSSTTIPTRSGSTNETITETGSSKSVTLLVGGSSPTANKTSSASATPTPVNTQPCNNYVEFCERSYANITEVAAHNSPFARKGNAFSNQDYSVTDQLNDGIRMIQGQTHFENNTLFYCHSSCSFLNVGTVEAEFKEIADWVAVHPFDVVTILMGNAGPGDIPLNNYIAPITNSGLLKYAYRPPKIPMAIGDWPTLSEMIISQKRVVIFMDYLANQTAVDYILDEFSQMWETPFSPTNTKFPCNVDRPPKLSSNDAKNRLYLANHNLNADIAIGSSSFLIPNTAVINQTNAANGSGSLGEMANTCESEWGRAPNFLLVDFYNRDGEDAGSVFKVAAAHNNVTYDRRCCGAAARSAGDRLQPVLVHYRM